MKKTLLTVLGVLLLAVPSVFADNLQDAQTAALKELNLSKVVLGGASTGIGLILKHTPVSGSTGAYVTLNDASMTFYSPFGTADTSIGSSGVVTFASTLGSNTMGGLCDYINNHTGYSCVLNAYKRDDVTSNMTTQTATDGTSNLEAAGGLQKTIGSAAGIRLGIVPIDSQHRIILKQCQGKYEVANTLYVYGASAKTNGIVDQFGTAVNDSTLVYKSPLTSDTLSYAPTQYNIAYWQAFAPGAHVVVSAGTLGSGANQGTSQYLMCSWSER